jgi:hypothetical protein
MTNKINKKTNINTNVLAGLVSGIIQAGLLNPWDRALYLSVKENRKFLTKSNFLSPYQGFMQVICQKSISGGLYFTLQSQLDELFTFVLKHNQKQEKKNSTFYHLLLGSSAGVLNGIILNQLAVIKYTTWNSPARQASFVKSIKDVYKQGGIKGFFKGIEATGVRDMVFGITYEVLRGSMRKAVVKYGHYRKEGDLEDDRMVIQKQARSFALLFFCDFCGAAVATVLSGPFNFVRNMKYATPNNEKPPTQREVFRQLWKEAKEYGTKMKMNKGLGIASYMQQRFRIGWGTARVGVGMGIGQWIFDYVKKMIVEK